MAGLGRDDLLLRGSRLWACGKCGFARNFSNRCKCLECGQRPTQWILDLQPNNAEDAEYQARVDDLERQMAALRKVAREANDASFVNAALENLERQAAAVRAERRAGWTVPRQLERQRARVAEREARVAKATERVVELEVEKAKLQADLDDARAHLAAKEEDLQAERAETSKLEKLLPTPVVADATAETAKEPIDLDLDAPDVEQTVVGLLRKLAARKGGAWGASLAAVAAPGFAAASGSNPQRTEQTTEEERLAQGQKDVAMGDAPAAQNALAPQPQPLVADSSAGAALSLVPSMSKRVQPTASKQEVATKVQRRG